MRWWSVDAILSVHHGASLMLASACPTPEMIIGTQSHRASCHFQGDVQYFTLAGVLSSFHGHRAFYSHVIIEDKYSGTSESWGLVFK